MKNVLLIVGIILLAVAVLALVFGLMMHHGYMNVMDASSAMLERLQRRATTGFVVAGASGVLGIAALVVRGLLK